MPIIKYICSSLHGGWTTTSHHVQCETLPVIRDQFWLPFYFMAGIVNVRVSAFENDSLSINTSLSLHRMAFILWMTSNRWRSLLIFSFCLYSPNKLFRMDIKVAY